MLSWWDAEWTGHLEHTLDMLKAQPASDFRPQTAASTESRNSNCRQIVRNNSSRNDNNTVGGLYHPPSWRGHSSGQRQAAKADIAPAAPLQANHRSAEDCRASQGDPTDSDAPGNPTRKPGAGGGNTWQQKQQPQQQRQQQEQQQQQCVGGPYHPPLWRCHGCGRRQPPRPLDGPNIITEAFRGNIWKGSSSSNARRGSQRQELQKMEEEDRKRQLSEVHGHESATRKAARATGWLRTTDGCGRSNRGDGHKLQTAEATATRWICNGIKDIHGCGRSNVAMGRNGKQLRKQGHVGYAMASGTYQTLLGAVHGKRLAETIECEESVAALLRRASQLLVVVQTAADT